jgi:hypothetical protein
MFREKDSVKIENARKIVPKASVKILLRLQIRLNAAAVTRFFSAS